VTGLERAGCYATAFGDCAGKLTREHYISKVVLDTIEPTGPLAMTGGIYGPTPKHLGSGSLTAKILCKRHNEGLSPLDVVGGKLQSALQWLLIPGEALGGDRVWLLNGHDVERWMLKTLCGMGAGSLYTSGGAKLGAWSPPLMWLQILFGVHDWPLGWGLYVEADGTTPSVAGEPTMRTSPLSHGPRLQGLRLSMCNLQFVLVVDDVAANDSHDPRVGMRYRPDCIGAKRAGRHDVLMLGWRIPGAGGSIEIVFEPIGAP
jgi:hypothetical protein